jgi:NACHT domain
MLVAIGVRGIAYARLEDRAARRYSLMSRNGRNRPTRGRSGGRAGGAGYDFQDLYVAFQLAKLLVGDPDPPIEILWEKKAVDWGDGIEPVHVDDVIIHTRSGKKIYVQVKETSPAGKWNANELARSGILDQFWRQWSAISSNDLGQTVLRLASGGDVGPINLIIDASRRARTPDEMLSDEASSEVVEHVKLIGEHLAIDAYGPILLAFLKAIEVEPLPAAPELEGWIAMRLGAAGDNATDLRNRLVRLVARSKHAGPSARSSFTRDSLVKALRDDGVRGDTLIAIGVLGVKPLPDSPAGIDIGGTSSRNAGEAVDEYAAHFSDMYSTGIEALVSTTVQTKEGPIESAQLIDRLSMDIHYLVVGKSGTGKTHLAKHMALRAIRNRVVPIFLRACDYRGEFSDLLDKSVAHSHPGTASDLLNSAYQARRQVVLIVDGFNECTERLKSSLIQDLQAFYLRWSIPITITSQASIALPSVISGDKLEMKALSDKEKKAVFVCYSEGNIGDEDVERFSEAFQTSYELSLAAQCVEEIREAPTRTSLFFAYVRRHCADTASPAVTYRILCELATIMGEQLVGSLSVGDVTQAGELVAAREEVSVKILDELFRSGLLEVRQGYCAFRHELLARFFQALAFVHRNDRADILASELAKPRYSHLAEFVISLQSDANKIRSCLRELEGPTVIAVVADCLRGHMGNLARELVSKDVRDLFHAGHRELESTELSLELTGRGSGFTFSTLEVKGVADWTKYDRALMVALGLVLSDGLFFDETVDLIRQTDLTCKDKNAVMINTKSADAVDFESDLFASLYAFTYSDNRHVFPASVITNAFSQDYHGRRRASLTDKVRTLCRQLYRETPGVLRLICLSLRHWLLDSDDDIAPLLPALLRACWDTKIYHVRLEVLHLVTDFGRSLHEPIKGDIEKTISSLDWEGNPLLSTLLIEALAAFGSLEPITTSGEIIDEFRRILEDPDSEVAQQQAYNAVSNVFEEIYDNLYWEAIKSLSVSDQVKLLTMASLGAPPYGMVTPSWILKELIRLNDPLSLRGFQRWATEIDPDTPSTQEATKCYFLGVRGCARFLKSPPLLKTPDTPDHLAWTLYGEIIFWTCKPDLDEAEIHTRCALPWKRLQHEVPLSAVDPMMHLNRISVFEAIQERHPVRDLFDRSVNRSARS